jgi:hypothetical protein
MDNPYGMPTAAGKAKRTLHSLTWEENKLALLLMQ